MTTTYASPLAETRAAMFAVDSLLADSPPRPLSPHLVRERGGDPADLTTIQKSHTDAYAAIGRLDG